MRPRARARATLMAGVSLVDSYRSNAGYLEPVGGDFAIVLRNVTCVSRSARLAPPSGFPGNLRRYSQVSCNVVCMRVLSAQSTRSEYRVSKEWRIRDEECRLGRLCGRFCAMPMRPAGGGNQRLADHR